MSDPMTYDLLDDQDIMVRGGVLLEVDESDVEFPFTLSVEGEDIKLTAKHLRLVVLRLNTIASRIWLAQGID